MTERPCGLCLAHPERLEGHEHLRASKSGPSNRMLFKCESCGSRWWREYEGSGVFVWVDQSRAIPPPPRAEGRPPAA